jgi:3-oxoacyl-[acyl-carrier protein] reductase
MRGLSGRVAVVTGGGKGIGAAVATRLAEEGARVAVLDLKQEFTTEVVDRIAAAGGDARGYAADVSLEDSVSAAFEALTADFGHGAEILVNNAGITQDSLLHKMTVDQWDRVMAVHLRGTFLCTQAAQRAMVPEKRGRIVNLSSTAALGNRGQANYSAAKAGIQGFTKTASLELGRYGITVNAIAPGFIVSDMTKAAAEGLKMPWEEFEAMQVSRIAIGRGGTPEDVAALAAFLASDDASFITGQVVYLTGQPRT